MQAERMIPVFCYHSMNAGSCEYFGNDHIALEADLAILKKMGYRAVSIADVVSFAKKKESGKEDDGQDKVFALTFDDAPSLDYYPYESSTIGTIKSFKDILIDSGMFDCAVPAISFAIASEVARCELDKTCMQGKGNWGSEWWRPAVESGLFEIGNHSFDHLHATLQKPNHTRGGQGNFLCVDNYIDAHQQVKLAYDEINALCGAKAAPYFAYPYGDVPDYLLYEYFPNFLSEHGMLGAFTTAGRSVVVGDNIWALPRYVCGDHWKSPEEFERILGVLA